MLSTMIDATGMGGLVLAVAGWLRYLMLIPKEKVPVRPTGFSALMLVIALAVTGSWVASFTLGQQPSLLSWIAGGNGLVLALFFLYLLSQAPLPDQPIAVAVGEALPAIAAPDGHGTLHQSSEWQGQRVLFKFFRGHW